MFKKALRITTALSVLLAAHAGYVRVFAIAREWLRPSDDLLIIHDADRVVQSATARKATELAVITFGKDHWTTKAPWRVYNAQRGFWMYAESYQRKKDGRQYIWKPFAIIWESKDKKSAKVAVADEAVTDFDQPVDVMRAGAKPGHVVHAQIHGNVWLRDDKGTPHDRTDDLEIVPHGPVEFDEPSLQLRSDSHVVIKDRDMISDCDGVRIDLRPNEQPSRSGFNGAKTMTMLSNVRILIKNVGRSGILPGTAKDRKDDPKGPTPLDLQCAGSAVFDLPEPAPPLEPGDPPRPPAPTIATFKRNVRVRRGTDLPDQLDCDTLRLTLLPAPKTAAADAASAPTQVAVVGSSGSPAASSSPGDASADDEEPAAGPLTELTLRRAEATGHNVWLQSKAQALIARGEQLIYEKNGPEQPDSTYFRGGATTPLWVQKKEYETEGATAGKIRFIDDIRTTDVTIFENGDGTGFSSVTARGPGRLETRAKDTGPVVRSANWQDELVMLTKIDAKNDQLYRDITLTGNPQVAETGKTITARMLISARLRKPKSEEGEFQLEWVKCLEDARLVTTPDPAKPNAAPQDVTGRQSLTAQFVSPPTDGPAANAGNGNTTSNTGASNQASNAIASETAPAVAAADQPGTTTLENAAPDQQTKPGQPRVDIVADLVWAQILQCPGSQNRGELQEARLRGDVKIHQDPQPGKTVGTDMSGEAADMFTQGEGKSRFRVDGGRVVEGRLIDPAKISNDEFTVIGPVIGLDQTSDAAWVNGPGMLSRLVAKNLLNESGPGAGAGAGRPKSGRSNVPPTSAAEEEPEKVLMTITWQSRMLFNGRLVDPQGVVRPGKAEFFADVHAKTEDAEVFCEDLETFMDRVISLTPPKRDRSAQGEPAEAQPKADIAYVRCRSPLPKHVRVINIKRDPATHLLLEKQRIEGQDVTYARLTGQFNVRGAGVVHLYSRKAEDGTRPATGAGSDAPRRAVPTAAKAASATRSGQPVEAKTMPQIKDQAKAQTKANTKGATRRPTTGLELTVVRFEKQMRGRFGSGKDAVTTGERMADFQGDVEVLHGPVFDADTDLDPDRPPPEYVMLSSQSLRVISEPPPAGSNTPAHNYLNALYNANATSRDQTGGEVTIQGDQITYDSAKKLFYVYATEGREITIAKQESPGQPLSTTHGQSAMYNQGTGQSAINVPSSFNLIDSNKTGSRAKDLPPPEPADKPKKPPRRDFRLPPKTDKERSGFRGH